MFLFISRKDDDDDSDASLEELDEDLEFENPLDSIPLKLPNGTTLELERPKGDQKLPDSNKKQKLDNTPMPQLRTVPSIKPPQSAVASNTLTTQPRTIPGLKKDEFLIPTVNNATGQQQFLVVKRLEQGSTNVVRPNAPPLLKTVPSIVPTTQASSTTNPNASPLSIKLITTPPPIIGSPSIGGTPSSTPKGSPTGSQRFKEEDAQQGNNYFNSKKPFLNSKFASNLVLYT